MGYGIHRRRAQKARALPSAKTSRPKSVFSPVESNLADAIHFRAPEIWRGRVKSKRVRKWFTKFLEGSGALAPADPGPGPLEVSVRISRRDLNSVARRFGLSGAALLRQLIAAQLWTGSSEGRIEKPVSIIQKAPVSAPESLGAWLQKLIVPTALPPRQFPAVVPAITKPQSRLNFITQVQGVRSLQEIDSAKRRGDGITFEELLRWRAVFDRQ
jgi:hypothetical protein